MTAERILTKSLQCVGTDLRSIFLYTLRVKKENVKIESFEFNHRPTTTLRRQFDARRLAAVTRGIALIRLYGIVLFRLLYSGIGWLKSLLYDEWSRIELVFSSG